MVTSRLARAATYASATLASITVLCTALPAWACPACTTRGSGGYWVPLLLGAMILTPYAVSTVVLRIIRKGEAERALEDEMASANSVDKPNRSHRSQGDPAAGNAPARA